MAPPTVFLRCKCGEIVGQIRDLTPADGNHIVCLCDDCQAFAHHLNVAKEVLDPNGGTEIFQLAPSKIQITQGSKNLSCLRLTEKGLVRWFAGCCHTPIANTTASSQVPFAGLIHTFMKVGSDESVSERALGPVLGRIQGKFGIPPLLPGTSDTMPLALIVRTIKFFIKGWLRGQAKPSPFFNASGALVVRPKVLSEQERESLRRYCGPNPKA